MSREIKIKVSNILLFHIIQDNKSYSTACDIKKTRLFYHITFNKKYYKQFMTASWICKKCKDKLK